MKERTAEFLVILALTLGLTGVAAPAQASHDSPEQAVEKFWDRIQFGEGKKALAMVKKPCRTPQVRRNIVKMSKELWDLLKDTPFYLGIGAYKEHVHGQNGREAKVTYWVTLTDLDYYEEALVTIRNQRWVRINDRWVIDCKVASVMGTRSTSVDSASPGGRSHQTPSQRASEILGTEAVR